MKKKISVMVVDDHTVLRGGLRLFLMAFPDMELVSEAGNGAQAVQLCDIHRPDVILMDLLMPEMNGVEATRQIREKHPEIQIIALTSFPDEQLVQDALGAGAIGYLIKTVSADELADAIRAAAEGRVTLSPEAATALVHKTQHGTLHEELTDREWQVFQLIIAGKSNAAIGEELVIGVSTVKYHVGNIFSKLGVKKRSEAIAYAIQHHLMGGL